MGNPQSVFQFQDKQQTIKHLCFIIEVKKIDQKTMRIKETIMQGAMGEDLLFYDNANALSKDMKKIFVELDNYNKYINDIKKAKENIGFDPSAMGYDSGEENPDEEPQE